MVTSGRGLGEEKGYVFETTHAQEKVYCQPDQISQACVRWQPWEGAAESSVLAVHAFPRPDSSESIINLDYGNRVAGRSLLKMNYYVSVFFPPSSHGILASSVNN